MEDEIYLKKLPSKCIDCMFIDDCRCSILSNKLFAEKKLENAYIAYNTIRLDCPLRSLKDHDAEKDKQIEELKLALELACNQLERKYMFAQDENTRKIIPLTKYFIEQSRCNQAQKEKI